MNLCFRSAKRWVLPVAAALAIAPVAVMAQSNSSNSSNSDRWIHIRVISQDSGGETVRVNVPVDMAEKILPAINKKELHNGKVTINSAHCDDVDLKALLDAVRTAKDSEFVTVQSDENDVRVAKQAGYLLIHVTEKQSHDDKDTKDSSKDSAKDSKSRRERTRVEIKVPMKVVDALFSSGTDQLDLVAALHALSQQPGDTELVSVKDNNDSVRVWVDSKNVSE